MLGWQNFPGHDNNDPAAGLVLGDVQVTPLPADTHTARMDLVFFLRERWTEAGEPAGISAGRWSFAPTCSTRPASRR